VASAAGRDGPHVAARAKLRLRLRRQGLRSAEPLPRRVALAGVEVDHEPAGRDQCLLLQAPPLLPRLHPFDRVAVTDDITALEYVVPGVAQVGGKARQFQLRMETNSVITQPSGMMEIRPGYNRITGLAWSGHGKIAKVEVSTDGARSWKEAQLNQPVLPKAQTRFQMDWTWDGKPTEIVSRSTDDKGNVQPTRKSFIGVTGTNAVFHYNAQQTWRIDETGRVTNVLD